MLCASSPLPASEEKQAENPEYKLYDLFPNVAILNYSAWIDLLSYKCPTCTFKND